MSYELVFAPHTSSKLNDVACKMYETHGSATHEAQTQCDETVLLFPVYNGKRLALCFKTDYYGNHQECADEWELDEADLKSQRPGWLSLDVSSAIF